jgi:hypothetical protein
VALLYQLRTEWIQVTILNRGPLHAGFSFNLLIGELEALYGEKS